jgi:hypothetical protein
MTAASPLHSCHHLRDHVGRSDAFSNLADGIYLPVSYSIGQSALASCDADPTSLLLNFRNQPALLEKAKPDPPFPLREPSGCRSWLLIVLATIALLFGYISLANFIVFKLLTRRSLLRSSSSFTTPSMLQCTSFDPAAIWANSCAAFQGWAKRAIEGQGCCSAPLWTFVPGSRIAGAVSVVDGHLD